MKKQQDGFVTLAALVIALIVAGGITTGIVLHEQSENKTKTDGSDQPTYTVPRELEIENAPIEKPKDFNCKKDLCVESGKLNVGIYQTEYRVDVAQYKLTNGTDKAISIDKIIFTHPSSYNFNGLLSLNFALNVNGKQVGSAPAFVNRGNYYDLAFLKGNGQFDSFMMAPYETITLEIQNSVSPFSTGGNVEIFLSEIETSNGLKFSGNISGGKIPVADVVGKSDCQEKFGTMKNPSTGKIQPIRVHLLSPNNGKYNQGDTLMITWETCDLPELGQLFRAYLGGVIIVSEGPEAVNDGVQAVKIPNNIPDGNHTLSIEVLDMYHGGGDYITFDDSDGQLTIGNVQTQPDPTPPSNPGNTQTYPYIPTDPTNPYQFEAEAKGKLSSFRAEAEIIFDQNNGSYDGVCNNGSGSHNLFMEARELLGMSQDNDCKENNSKYRVWVEMVSSNQIFCVDSTGYAGLTYQSSLSVSSYACTQ